MPSEFLPLTSVARVFAGVPTKRYDRKSGEPPVRVLSVRALNGRKIEPSELIRVLPLSRDRGKYTVAPGDIIIPARSTSFTAAIVPDELDGIAINATLIGIKCGERLLPELLVAYLRHPAGLAAIEERSQSGTLQMNITVRALEDLPVPVPPIEHQKRIADMLESADAAHEAAIQAAARRRRLAGEVAYQEMTRATA